MQLGVHVGQQNMSMGEMRAIWRQADALGADWISVGADPLDQYLTEIAPALRSG